ncbi:type II toxin-antitoxin system RnlB family antitoxin [Leptolyngbya sp. AN03gr2]|uniref:type II toxin-antitoxin system RnlB family antitoxin n=1 Tax=unclassified Leptolyngbya TaxID=2650499 RepID=UPI003D311BE0
METLAIALVKDTALVLQLSQKNALDYLPDIAATLNQRSFQGTVVFDLFVSKTFASDRFVKGTFFNGKFDQCSLTTTEEIDSDILEIAAQFYQENPRFLQQNQSITPEQIQTLLKTE